MVSVFAKLLSSRNEKVTSWRALNFTQSLFDHNVGRWLYRARQVAPIVLADFTPNKNAMNDSRLIKIEFDERTQRFLAFVFMEVFGGGSTGGIQAVLGDSVPAARELEPVVRAQAESESGFLELTKPQWKTMYESLNAVIYGLGPAELSTCTGMDLAQAANINLEICARVWGVYKGRWRWDQCVTKKLE